MIDIHSHLLFNPKENRNATESKIILKQMIAIGFDTLFAISSYDPEISDLANVSKREMGLDILYRNIYEEAELVTLLTGSEISLDQDILSLLDKKVIELLGQGRYLLVNIPKTMTCQSAIFKIDLLVSEGIIPILTDLEKQKKYLYQLSNIYRFIQSKALIHVDYNSILGFNGKETQYIALKFLRHHFIDILGSNIKDSKNQLLSNNSSFLKQLDNLLEEQQYQKLMEENPQNIVEDKEIINEVFQHRKRY